MKKYLFIILISFSVYLQASNVSKTEHPPYPQYLHIDDSGLVDMLPLLKYGRRGFVWYLHSSVTNRPIGFAHARGFYDTSFEPALLLGSELIFYVFDRENNRAKFIDSKYFPTIPLAVIPTCSNGQRTAFIFNIKVAADDYTSFFVNDLGNLVIESISEKNYLLEECKWSQQASWGPHMENISINKKLMFNN